MNDLTAREIMLKADVLRELRADDAVLPNGESRLVDRCAMKATNLSILLALPLIEIIEAEKADPTGILASFAGETRDLGMLLHALRPRTSPIAERILERAEATLTQLESVPAE